MENWHSRDWHDEAACKKEDPEIFYPEGHGKVRAERIAAAKAICLACPVLVECQNEAYMQKEQFGVRGGINFERPKERKAFMEFMDNRLVPKASMEPEAIASSEEVVAT